MATKKEDSKKEEKSGTPADKPSAKTPADKKGDTPAAKGTEKKPSAQHGEPAQEAGPGKVASGKEVKAEKGAAKKPVPVSATDEGPGDVVENPADPAKKPALEASAPEEGKPAIRPLEKPAAKAGKSDTSSGKTGADAPGQESSGPTMRYSDAELIEFRELINRKLETAKKELNYLQGLITRKDESGDLDEGRYMTMEDGSMSMEREQLSQMASRQIQFIDHLEKAMMRIENKTYGVCRVTGKLIDKARLRAVPHATLSIEAKQMMNK